MSLKSLEGILNAGQAMNSAGTLQTVQYHTGYRVRGLARDWDWLKKYIEVLGGRIEVTTQLGVGTICDLPAEDKQSVNRLENSDPHGSKRPA